MYHRTMLLSLVIATSFLFDGSPIHAQQQPYHEALRFGAGSIDDAAWSPDGQTILVTSRTRIRLYSSDLQPIATLVQNVDPAVEQSADWSPDGKWIAYINFDAQPEQIVLWNVQTQKAERTLGKLVRLPSDGVVASYRQVAWSPDGKMIGAVDNNFHLFIWDAQTGETLQTLKVDADHLQWSHDGNRVAAFGLEGFEVVDVETGKFLIQRGGEDQSTNNLALSPDGARVAVIIGDVHTDVY